MQQLLLLTVLIGLSICAVIPRPTINETHFKDAIDREIMEALRSIDEAKKNIENSKNTVRHELEKSEIENTTFSIGNEMRWLFDSMMNAVHDVHVPFMTRSIENETVLPTTTTSMPDNSSLVHDFMEKTREEMKKDIDLLREYYDDIRVEFDEWVISNKHQNWKSMMIGAISAIIILFIYSIVVKCCTRRTREQLSSFAQDRPANRNGDNQYLLGQDSKRVRRFPSNSDEDI